MYYFMIFFEFLGIQDKIDFGQRMNQIKDSIAAMELLKSILQDLGNTTY